MLSGLLPSLRHIRATLAAGLLWMVAGRIWFEPGLSADEHPGIAAVWRAVKDIADVAPPTSVVVALLFAAYLLGVISEAALGALTRWVTIRLVVVHRRIAGRWATPGGALGKTTTLDAYLNGAFARSKQWFASGGSDRAADKVRRTLLLARTYAPDVASDVDRLRAEAEFRLQLAPPVVGLTIAVGHEVSWLLALISIPCLFVLAASANHCVELANDQLADWAQTAGVDR